MSAISSNPSGIERFKRLRVASIVAGIAWVNSSMAIDIVNTDSAGQQTPTNGFIYYPSAVSNNGDTVLFWGAIRGLVSIPPGPQLFPTNLFVKTVSNNAITEVIRRTDGLPNTQTADIAAEMNEPPTRIVFRSNEGNLVPGLVNLGNYVYSTEIRSFQYNLIMPQSGLVYRDALDFSVTADFTKLFHYGYGGFPAAQIREISVVAPGPEILHSVRPDGGPTQQDGDVQRPPDMDVSANGRILVWRGTQLDIAPLGTGPISSISNSGIMYMRNTQTRVTRTILADDGSNLFYPRYPRIADNGSLIAFNLQGYFLPDCSSGIVGIQPDTWVRECISVNDAGDSGDGISLRSGSLDISADGNRVVFSSNAENLSTVPRPSARLGIYVRDRKLKRTVRIDINAAGQAGNLEADFPRISKNGRWVVFTSESTNLIANDANGTQPDLFRVDLNRFLPDPNTPALTLPAVSPWAAIALMFALMGFAAVSMPKER